MTNSMQLHLGSIFILITFISSLGISTFALCFVGLHKTMGEIDTKPIESVQTALSLFGQTKNRSTSISDDEKERELENVLRDLANYKVQLEVKEAAYLQALLKLEQAQKLINELSSQVKSNESEALARTRARERELEVERDVEKWGFLGAQERKEEAGREVESEVLSKTILADTLVLQLQEANRKLIFLQEELEIESRKNSSQEALIEAFKIDAREWKLEQKNANETTSRLIENVKTLDSDLQKAKAEIYVMREMVNFEAEGLRKELEAATAKVAELRNRAEQATCRAEVSERAKAAIEDQLRKWRDERRKKKAALREDSKKVYISAVENPQATIHYQPLYKLLNMKF